MADHTEILKRRLAGIEERIRSACQRVGRHREEITLVAVTKSTTIEVAAALVAIGVVDLGENRPQELWRKAGLLPQSVHWHLVGHLQRNKVARTAPILHLIHSVDSLRLLQALDEEVGRTNTKLNVLIEFNLSREAQKRGFRRHETTQVIPAVQSCRHLTVIGLMTIASLTDDVEKCRPVFRELRQLRDDLRSQLDPQHSLKQLSMGMSNDFEVAVEEGATFLRIGTALLEGLQT